MADHEGPRAQIIDYSKPENQDVPKTVTLLARTDRVFAAVQNLLQGGENNLHHHKYQDGFWFVLSGRVRFYTVDDEVVGEFGRHQGVLLPRGYPVLVRVRRRRALGAPPSRGQHPGDGDPRRHQSRSSRPHTDPGELRDRAPDRRPHRSRPLRHHRIATPRPRGHDHPRHNRPETLPRTNREAQGYRPRVKRSRADGMPTSHGSTLLANANTDSVYS